MLKDGSKITVHFINHWNHKNPTEEKTEYTGQVFTVKTENGKQGFDGNLTRSPYTCKGELFTPFSVYAWTVIFKDVETGDLYRFSCIKNELEKIGTDDEYLNAIEWIK